MVTVTLVKSTIGRPPKIKKTAKALGLTKVNKSVTFKEMNPSLSGMIKCVMAVVKVEGLK